MTRKLKPCPFCQSEDIEPREAKFKDKKGNTVSETKFFENCTCCGAGNGVHNTREESERDWNMAWTQETRLRPCPICQADYDRLVISRKKESDNNDYYVECVECGLKGPANLERAETIKQWNRRPEQIRTKTKTDYKLSPDQEELLKQIITFAVNKTNLIKDKGKYIEMSINDIKKLGKKTENTEQE